MVLFAPANHRFFTHFGEDHCRMSSTHSVLEAPERKHSHILTAVSRALFDIPIQHQARLENLWVDEINYASAWRKYVSERIEDLKLHMIWVSQTLPWGQSMYTQSFLLSEQLFALGM